MWYTSFNNTTVVFIGENVKNPQVKPVNLAPSEDRYVPDTVESFRPGALDYRDHPSRIGGTLVPYKSAKALTSNVKKTILGSQP